MTAFGEGLLGGSRFLFWALAPFLLLGAAAVTFPPEYEDGFHLAAVIACDVTAVLLTLSLWPYHRIPLVRRLMTGAVACAFTYYVLDAWAPDLLPRKGSASNPWLASAGFLVIGVPSWKYALLGRFRFTPLPLAMAADEPLLLQAYEEARAALPRLRSAFAECAGTTFVRFPFQTDQDEVEHLWGRLLELFPSHAELEVVTQPLTHDEVLGVLRVPVSELEDWEAEFPDGGVEGGYTTRAMCAYARRESLAVPREIEKRLRRYRTAG